MAIIKTPNLLDPLSTKNETDIVCIWDIDESEAEKMKRMSIGEIFTNTVLHGTTGFSGAFYQAVLTISSSQTDLDVSSHNVIAVDTGSGNVTISGLKGGTVGQVIRFIKSNVANTLSFTHNTGTGTHSIITPAGYTISLEKYGGITLTFNGSAWVVTDALDGLINHIEVRGKASFEDDEEVVMSMTDAYASGDYKNILTLNAPNMPIGKYTQLSIGKANASYNNAEVTFYYAADGSTSNEAQLGLNGNASVIRARGDGAVGIKSGPTTNAALTLGDDLIMSDWDDIIRRNTTGSSLTISGSNDINDGAALRLYGSTPSSNPNVGLLMIGGTVKFQVSSTKTTVADYLDVGSSTRIGLNSSRHVEDLNNTKGNLHLMGRSGQGDGSVYLNYYQGDGGIKIGDGNSNVVAYISATGTSKFGQNSDFVYLSSSGGIEICDSAGGAWIDLKSASGEDYDCRIRQYSNGLNFFVNGSASAAVNIGSGGVLNCNNGMVTHMAGSSTSSITINADTDADSAIYLNENGAGKVKMYYDASANTFRIFSSDHNENYINFYSDGAVYIPNGYLRTSRSSVPLWTENTSTSDGQQVAQLLVPNMTNGQGCVMRVGKNTSETHGCGELGFYYFSNGNDYNQMRLGVKDGPIGLTVNAAGDTWINELTVSNADYDGCLTVNNDYEGSSTMPVMAHFFTPKLATAGHKPVIRFGKTPANFECGELMFNYAMGSAHVSNYIELKMFGGPFGGFKLHGDGKVKMEKAVVIPLSAPSSLENGCIWIEA